MAGGQGAKGAGSGFAPEHRFAVGRHASGERRLARILLLLAHFGKESKMESVVPGITQEALAQMIGTTRSRVNHFMNKFKRLGFISYNGSLTVNSGLPSVLLAHDMSELIKR
jgi:CRP/FNR family transcriptional regulator, cyclic AMP receptor protein